MTLHDEKTGLDITLKHDEDGFPLITIETNNNCTAEHFRPAVEVNLNGVMIHDMFDEEDRRWTDVPEEKTA